MSAENNLCTQAGCKSACCRDVYFHFVYTPDQILRAFPAARKVGLNKFNKAEQPGVYYCPDGIFNFKTSRVRIIGPCPNLVGVDCRIWKDKLKDCENFYIGHENCVEFRRRQSRVELVAL